ncbi:AP2/ERF and B3 domain-containing transcription factor At1g51120 [Daucus carota subsp. sativus]|uniref:AP2/ERF and B3 domain-containing transcription factor At1g51120 n=1 Tax=Daucus carota subsp. sativus TaxID=79200 RepID=UPI00308383FC
MGDLLNFTAFILGLPSGLNSRRDDQSSNERARHNRNISGSSSVGVIKLPNENWEAYTYDNNNWSSIGIFETEKKAAIAFESRTIEKYIEFWNGYLQRISNGEQEPLTLELASTRRTLSSSSGNISQGNSNRECIRTKLFDKVLTSSDVSKINRLVIPKTFSGFFPCISNENGSSSRRLPVNNVELNFYDESKKLWQFRYCYWKKSRTYSFSKGWSKFVEEKDLRPKDKIIFLKCEYIEAGSIVGTRFIIDVEYDPSRVQVEEVGDDLGDPVVLSPSQEVQNLQNEENGGEVRRGSADGRSAKRTKADKDSKGAGPGEAAGRGAKRTKADKNSKGAGPGEAAETGAKRTKADKNSEGAGPGEAAETGAKRTKVDKNSEGAGPGEAAETGFKLFGVRIA